MLRAARTTWEERRTSESSNNEWSERQRSHVKGAKFIVRLGKAVKLDMVSIATACAFFHHYYNFAGELDDSNRHIVMMACLFLGAKAECKYCSSSLIVSHGLNLHDGSVVTSNDDAHPIVLQAVYDMQFDIMQRLDFEFSVDHPFSFIPSVIERLREPSGLSDNHTKRLTEKAWDIARESVLTTLCLQYSPRHVATATVFMASCWFSGQFSLQLADTYPEGWWNGLQCSSVFIKDIANQIKFAAQTRG